MERRRDTRTQGPGENQATESAPQVQQGGAGPQEARQGGGLCGAGLDLPLLRVSVCAAGLLAPHPAVLAVLESGLRC